MSTWQIDREARGLSWNVGIEARGWLVGKEITLDLDIAAVDQSASASATQAA